MLRVPKSHPTTDMLAGRLATAAPLGYQIENQMIGSEKNFRSFGDAEILVRQGLESVVLRRPVCCLALEFFVPVEFLPCRSLVACQDST